MTDGYAAYSSYAKKVGIARALCWSHSRREFVDAQTTEPQGVLEALRRIGALYAIEEDIRRLGLTRAGGTQCKTTIHNPGELLKNYDRLLSPLRDEILRRTLAYAFSNRAPASRRLVFKGFGP